MGVYAVWSVSCDGIGPDQHSGDCEWWIGQEPRKRDAKWLAEKHGWKRRRREGRIVYLCPACEKGRKNDAKNDAGLSGASIRPT